MSHHAGELTDLNQVAVVGQGQRVRGERSVGGEAALPGDPFQGTEIVHTLDHPSARGKVDLAELLGLQIL